MRLLWIVVAGIAIVVAPPVKAGEWNGAARVVDGDTLAVGTVRLRLISIDAPEGAQFCQWADGSPYRCGDEATRALERLIGPGPVACVGDKTDRYGRPLVVCRVGNVNLNAEMVRLGWAVTYLGPEFEAEEREARDEKRGMWAGAFQRPSDWRRENKR